MLLIVGSGLGGCIVVNVQEQYESCDVSDDCRVRDNCVTVTTDSGAAGNMCTRLDCASEFECDIGRNGLAGACLDILGSGGNLCYERCTTDSDCTQLSWGCNPLVDSVTGQPIANVCLPGASAPPPPPALLSDYERCEMSAECATGLLCAAITTASAMDNMCTLLDCTGDSQCGAGRNGESGACLDILGSGGTVCYERCVADTDCTGAGWTCSDATDSTGAVLASVCLPF